MTSIVTACKRNKHLILLTRNFAKRQNNHPKYCYNSTHISVPTPPVKKTTFRGKFKETWNGPNFKYWFIGGTGFISWMGYYGLKNYKKKCLDIEIFPPMPNHALIEREIELEEIYKKYESQISLFDRTKIKHLAVIGVPGTGKTVLIKEFIEFLKRKHSESSLLPKSNINVFLQSDTESSFLFSLKSFAAKLNIKQTDLDEKVTTPETTFSSVSFTDQCNILLECIQEELYRHPGWVIVIDNIQQTISQNINHIIKDWFVNEGNKSGWSSGTLVFINEGANNKITGIDKQCNYYMHKGFTMEDGVSFIKIISNLEENTANTPPIKQLLERVYLNPLGVLCVGIMLHDVLAQQQTESVKDAVNSVLENLEKNTKQVINDNEHMVDFIKTYSGFKLLTLQTVISMAMKIVLRDNLYLNHGLDMIAALSPTATSSQSLLTRHFLDPFFKLPSLGEKQKGLLEMFNKQQSDMESIQSKINEFEPKSKIWSNKNITEYVKKVEEYFMLGWTTIKDIYNLVYGELPPLPPRNDGLDMFRSCKLLQTGQFQPSEAKNVSMHPLVYNVARQHFLGSSINDLEEKHLKESLIIYNSQSWYKKLNGFSEQSCLHKFRNSKVTNNSFADKKIVKDSTEVQVERPGDYLFRYNFGINFASVFNDKLVPQEKEEFWLPKDIDKFHYLQSHLSRVITSICNEIKVAKQDLSGKAIRENSMQHLEYILQNHPVELIPFEKRIDALQTIASCYVKLYHNTSYSKDILENVLQLQRDCSTTNPLSISKTLTKLAEIYNYLNDYDSAKQLLEEAAELHEKDRRKHGEYKESLEFGALLGLLGVVYGSLSMKIESKETIERSLMLLQAVPPNLNDEAVSKQYGGDFASALTDLGHSYVSLGLPLYGKKILDLALAAHKNIHGEHHSEVVRTTTILGIAHLMQGHNEESKRLRTEAGKLQAAINKIPNY